MTEKKGGFTMTTMHHLDDQSPAIQHLVKVDKRLAKLIATIGPIDYHISDNSYGYLVANIVGQMLSNKVAAVILKRLQELCGGHITMLAIKNLSDDAIHGVGLSKSKVGYIRSLTTAVETGQVDFASYPAMSDEAVLKDLTTIRGIGNWSAKMYLFSVLDRPDVLPVEDKAFLQGYGWLYKTTDFSAAAVRKKAEKWRPYRTIAAKYLYRAVDLGLTKTPFHLFKD
ncbi:DNA-3-methyladenine glycosylase family protein [Secundilactobacillus collinoides]|uniref:DNA-3-methyladenine glycosylase II n=1 Tax=Secundilactobacillus collinoides DSM 20515 = JCM 1123 TaxID=1423733 RepID=A0A0R2BN25_SECCO|nr:DNA-3-methyladenine glycosylase 2 family protein [Secundilactobacillus collinoides]KRM77142.1 hypothetical protein FC82_GL000380 [Secundilactobacillus collinoides DSM 20515 = JCM 1123]